MLVRNEEEESLPEFACTPCRLTDEDDDGEDVSPVQPPHTVQAQRQHTVNTLQDEQVTSDFNV